MGMFALPCVRFSQVNMGIIVQSCIWFPVSVSVCYSMGFIIHRKECLALPIRIMIYMYHFRYRAPGHS